MRHMIRLPRASSSTASIDTESFPKFAGFNNNIDAKSDSGQESSQTVLISKLIVFATGRRPFHREFIVWENFQHKE